jgi:hypothetical protein
MNEALLNMTKANLILAHDQDDDLLRGMIAAAVAYAEGYQHRAPGWYLDHPMPATTERAVVMLATHMYESREGSSGGFFGDSVQAARQVWHAAHDLLRMDRDWGRCV